MVVGGDVVVHRHKVELKITSMSILMGEVEAECVLVSSTESNLMLSDHIYHRGMMSFTVSLAAFP